MIIAIDGPAGSGKSTIAREVAKRLGLRYIDTGAMYRAVTLLALEAGLVPDRVAEAGEFAANAPLRLMEREHDLTRVFVGEREITDEIRGPLVSQNVSLVSAHPAVRAVLTKKQQEEAAKGGVVLEGRDTGTVVVPGADVKVFLTATVEERAKRRRLQLQALGVYQELDQLIADIIARDAYDSGRELAPLRRADDAVEIDTTSMSIEQVVAEVYSLALSKKGHNSRRAMGKPEPAVQASAIEQSDPARYIPPTQQAESAQATQAAQATHPLPQAEPVRAGDPTAHVDPSRETGPTGQGRSTPQTGQPIWGKKWPLCRMIRSPLDRLPYRFLYSFVPTLMKLAFRMRIEGLQNIPATGPVVLASNHRSNLDPFFLGSSFPRMIHFMGKEELWRFKPLGWLIEKLGAFPVRRGQVDRAAVRRALEILDAGAVVGLFPEGHREREKELGEIRTGVAMFSLREGVKTIPVVMRGTDRVVRNHLLHLPRVRVAFGPPLELPSQELPRSEQARIVTERLADAFRELLQVTAK